MKFVRFFSEIRCRFSKPYPFFLAQYLPKLILGRVFLALITVGVVGCETQLAIPQEVSTAFWAKYENATNIEWSSTEEVYTVFFDLMEHPKSATFKTDGEWIKTISILAPKRAIICLQEFVDENYSGMQITKVVFIEMPTSEKYFVTIGVKQEHEKRGEQNEAERDASNHNQGITDTPGNTVLEFYSNCEFVVDKEQTL